MEYLKPCPRCCCTEVEWTNSRDLDILTSYVQCLRCDLQTFHVDSLAFLYTETTDYENAVKKYNSWVDTDPTRYADEDWGCKVPEQTPVKQEIRYCKYNDCGWCYYKGDKTTTDNNGQCNSPQECEVNCE